LELLGPRTGLAELPDAPDSRACFPAIKYSNSSIAPTSGSTQKVRYSSNMPIHRLKAENYHVCPALVVGFRG